MSPYRQVTPPSAIEFEDYDALPCPGGSGSTNASYYPKDWSPDSVITVATRASTPPRSPPKVREIGPTLLPRVRTQDQVVESTYSYSLLGHNRVSSAPPNAYPLQPGGRLPHALQKSRSPSPFGMVQQLPTPLSAVGYDHGVADPVSRRPSPGYVRSSYTLNVPSHSRNNSSTSVDANVLGRYGFPTYRQSPTPQPVPTGTRVSVSCMPTAMSHLAPIAMPNGQMHSYPARRRTASPAANPSRLSGEMVRNPQPEMAVSTILQYLTAPNPTPNLTQRISEPSRSQNMHWWFDIRNVRNWTDFNVDTLSAMPKMLKLLNCEVPHHRLPTPARVSLNPDTPARLAELCANHHAVKVNAALAVSLGDKHMAMQSLRPVSGGRQQPEFVSNLRSDTEKTIYGEGRGRVVGIVKCFDQWNSGLRNNDPNDRVKYLNGLAKLQRFMREHGTRYGFIITEIELVCVRAGGPIDDSQLPYFGHVEVAAPVQISTHGLKPDGEIQMTAGLALWYLHMLAKEQPLPGQRYWKMDVGGPAALTRQHHMDRDGWMSKPSAAEQREAKRIRGWALPHEPLSNKETGRGRRRR